MPITIDPYKDDKLDMDEFYAYPADPFNDYELEGSEKGGHADEVITFYQNGNSGFVLDYINGQISEVRFDRAGNRKVDENYTEPSAERSQLGKFFSGIEDGWKNFSQGVCNLWQKTFSPAVVAPEKTLSPEKAAGLSSNKSSDAAMKSGDANSNEIDNSSDEVTIIFVNNTNI